MAHDLPSNEPKAPSTAVASRAIRHDGWTPDKQVEFLQVLATTQSVSAAARAVGMGRQSAYKLRARLDDAPFGAAWRLAMRSGRDILIEAALERAIHGVEVPHYWKGELIGTSRRFDERLTALLLASPELQGPASARPVAEGEFAKLDLSRLLDRVANGPAEWCDFASESGFAWGDYLEEEEELEAELGEDDNDEGADDQA